MRHTARLFALLLFVSCVTAVRAQSVQILLINGKTGRPITHISWLSPRTIVHIGLGPESELSLSLTADKHGVIPLRFTRDDSEVTVPDCKDMDAAWDKLSKNGNKKNDVRDFNKKYKNCSHFSADNPVLKLGGLISIDVIVRTLGDKTYFLYYPCWANSNTGFSTEEILQHGVVTANSCGKATASPEPRKLILFVRLPTQKEAARQALD